MEIPGGAAGVRRIGTSPSLRYPLSPQVINPPHYYEHYWWSWNRLRYLVTVIKTRGVENVGEWKRLAGICRVVSAKKRAYLFREFRSVFSEASLEYLFGGVPG
jgi:hypothetical protein